MAGGGFDLMSPQQDFSQYTFEMPQQSTFAPVTPEAYGSYQSGNMFGSNPYQGGMGAGQGPTDYSSFTNPYPSAVQQDSPYSGSGPSGPGTTQQQFGPSTGQGTGSSGASQNAASKEDDWKKMLLKLGIGGGIGALGSMGSAAVGAMMQPGQPKQQSSPLPQAPSSAIPQTAPMTPLPGTQASPLISGMPTSVQQSTGLQTQDRMRRGGSTGGLQLY